MSVQTESYISSDLTRFFRSQAYRAWGVAALIVFAWVLLIVLAPVLSGGGVSDSIYSFYGYICHQMPGRSLYFAGHPLAVCTRCSGVYFGLMSGLLAYPLWRRVDDIEPLPRIWLILSLVPMGLDWAVNALGIWENTHLSRFLTGLILGIACATYIVPAVVEIRRNVSLRRRAAA